MTGWDSVVDPVVEVVEVVEVVDVVDVVIRINSLRTHDITIC